MNFFKEFDSVIYGHCDCDIAGLFGRPLVYIPKSMQCYFLCSQVKQDFDRFCLFF
jgi:hypothetical protein